MLFGLAGVATATAIGLSFVAASGHDQLLGRATIIRYCAGAAVASAVLAAAGVAVGTRIRSQIGAIITIFVWGFIIEHRHRRHQQLRPALPSLHRRWRNGRMKLGGEAASPLSFAA